jgi:protoporphyrin/coproporphyrin ferrochelatase
MKEQERVGIILINTGTTAAPRTAETREYLREFLSDPRVLDMPAAKRWLLLNGIILRKRPAESAKAYAAIWTDEGSPLIVLSEQLRAALEERLPHAVIRLGMRYGEPSIPRAMDALTTEGVDRIIAAPLFPQYTSAANGSALELVYKLAAGPWNVPALSALPAFYDDSGFLDAWRAVAGPALSAFQPDYVLLSYHGLPERHVRKSDATGTHCLTHPDCCDTISTVNQYCYRAQCVATSRALAARLGLTPENHSTSFQSRLGREPWLTPPTDEVIVDLARRGVKRLAVLCPAFVTDCLETVEEIAIRGKDSFLEAGGEAFKQVPCPNAHPAWVDALAAMLRRI